MRAAFSYAVALVIGLAAMAPPASAGQTTPDANRSRAAVVIVSARIGYHRDAIGAGVVVAREPFGIRIVTARHVTEGGEVTVWIDGVGYRGDVVRTFAHRDIAIVDAIVPPDACAHVRAATLAESPVANDAIVVWGEDDAGPRMERGRVVETSFRAPDDAETPPLLAIECSLCERGDSGAGVFTADGRLIGVLVARYRASDHHIVATVAEFVDASLFAPPESGRQATAVAPASTVRSQNDPKLSPD